MAPARSLPERQTEDLVDRQLAALRLLVELGPQGEEDEERTDDAQPSWPGSRTLGALGRQTSRRIALGARQLPMAFAGVPRRARRFARGSDLVFYGLCIATAIVIGWLVGRM